MQSCFQNIKNRAQGQQNTKEIQNYLYYIDRVLGKGNYSTVYQAVSKKNKQRIAAKVISLNLYADPKMVQLLQQEIQILLTLDHPNIIKCYDVLKTSEECFCFTELCQGGTLANRIGNCGALPQHEIWPLLKDIYAGLSYLNSKSIIHRDIKAANIFIKEGKAKLADMGFAIQSRVPFKDLAIGSPTYMTPEGYINGQYTLKTDVWSFGIVLYQMLHGHGPFTHINDPAQLKERMKVQLQEHDFRGDLRSDLKRLMRCCLQIDESKRLTMAQIQFSDYFQDKTRRPSSYLGAQTKLANERMMRNRSTVTTIRLPSKKIEIRNVENLHCQTPKYLKAEEDGIIRLKSSVKVNTVHYEPYSAMPLKFKKAQELSKPVDTKKWHTSHLLTIPTH